MQDFVHFFVEHWALALGFIVVMAVIIAQEYQSQNGGGTRLSPSEVVLKINRESAKVLDLRSKEAFVRGHIVDALNVAAADLDTNLNRLEKFKKQPLVLCCAAGTSVLPVSKKLQAAGFSDLYILAGGMDAWTRDSLPLVKGEK